MTLFLRFSINMLGTKVRPRVARNYMDEETFSHSLPVYRHGDEGKEIFEQLDLDSYTGKITTLVFHSYEMEKNAIKDYYSFFTTKEELRTFRKQKVFTKDRLVGIGVQFYKDRDCKILAFNETFYYPANRLVDLKRIEKYEKLVVGDYVLTARTKGLVVEVKTLKKSKWWKTGSLCSKKVKLFYGHREGMVWLSPDQEVSLLDDSGSVASIEAGSPSPTPLEVMPSDIGCHL